MKTVNERLKHILKTYYKGNVSEFSRATGIPQPTLNNIVGNRMSKPSTENLAKIVNSIELINANWILTGEGDMLVKSPKDEAVPILNPNVKMIPLVSQYAQAGYLCGFSDEEYMEKLPKVPIIVDHEIKGEYIAFEVKGDSMDDGTVDSLLEGEVLIGRKIHPDYWRYKLHINKWNFIIVHKTEGVIVKRISEHDVENCTITAHSLNPMYPDRKIHLNDVSQLFNVVQILRSGRI